MEQQAKERLTGAGLLVVVLVLLVPALLTGPRPAPPPAPSQPDQAPMRSYTMDLGETTRVGSAPVAASTAVAAASEPAPPAAASLPHPTAAATAAPVPAAPPAPAADAAEAPNRPAAPVEHSPAARSAAPPAHTPVRATPEWTVQLGTFSSRENAARLVSTLKARGFSASLSETTHSGHRLFRVRIGAERTPAAAQKLLARLRAAGQKGGEVVQR